MYAKNGFHILFPHTRSLSPLSVGVRWSIKTHPSLLIHLLLNQFIHHKSTKRHPSINTSGAQQTPEAREKWCEVDSTSQPSLLSPSSPAFHLSPRDSPLHPSFLLLLRLKIQSTTFRCEHTLIYKYINVEWLRGAATTPPCRSSLPFYSTGVPA